MDSSDAKDPVYDIVDEKKATSLSEECPDTGSRYSMKTNELYSVVKENPKEVYKKSCTITITAKKILVCVLIAFILLLLFSLIFVVVAFIEISKLKSKETISPSPLQHLIMELNNSLRLNQDYTQKLKENITFLSQDISALNNTLFQRQSQFLTAPSCAAILLSNPSSPSGYYWITPSDDSAVRVRVYCDMTRSCGNITGGWMRVASLDMRDSSTQCPSGLRENIIDGTTIRTCVNRDTEASCSSDIFSTYNLPYSSVCGRIRAYQFGSTNAFITQMEEIESYYLDGISLTHGSPRQHIWTFVAALDEYRQHSVDVCPCFNISNRHSPSFVGDDYFCDTGSSDHFQFIFYSDDPLWDGDGCGGTNRCCSFNNPPWFYKRLPHATTDDIEVRVCRDDRAVEEDVAVELIEIYVQYN